VIILLVFTVCVELLHLKEKNEKKRVVHRCGRKVLKPFTSWFHNLEFCLNGKLLISEIGKIQLGSYEG